ncbi:DUF6048 family protein [Flavobacteriaceae bacterium M23B6Z8]
MLRFCISILICLLFSSIGFGQKESQDTLKLSEKYGLRIGADLSRPLRTFLDDNYSGFELVGDYRISKNFYIAGELGTEENTTEEDLYNFTTNGSYIKLGFDYNTYNNWFGMQNLVTVGMRYGFSTFSQTLNSYNIYNTNQFFNEGNTPGNNTELLGEYTGLNGQWVEGVIGVKVELFSNLYLGATVRINFLVSDKAAEPFPNLWIPGFNRVNNDSTLGLGYNYTLSYLIPIYRKAKGIKAPKE